MQESDSDKLQQESELVIIDSSKQQPELTASLQEISKLLAVIDEKIVCKTREGIRQGNKVFGAALLDKEFNFILAETNNEIKNPLFHGEVNLINEWSKMTSACDRGSIAQDAIFLSTHEPCCMCIRYVSNRLCKFIDAVIDPFMIKF
mmetsp:Transcript_15932/g.22696  ORF Transcript_15932/g.22696 Transcript_15932/m.22696 type:complete len:147 (+) Transcript_15932:19-459(+)